jgi:hypothetical protein
MARDLFHNQVKTALVKDGWTITHDPFVIQIAEAIKIQIDLGAESSLAAERDSEKIAIEIKSFVGGSSISEFHTSLGQYLNYSQAIEEYEADRKLYLAVPSETYYEFFQLPFIDRSIKRNFVNIVVYDPFQEIIESWITCNTIDK